MSKRINDETDMDIKTAAIIIPGLGSRMPKNIIQMIYISHSKLSRWATVGVWGDLITHATEPTGR